MPTLGSATSLLLALSLFAPNSRTQVPTPTRAQEIALAESAAPPEIAASAGIWALARHGYEQVRASSNGFVCLVERSAPGNLEPICYDEEGAAAILPVTLEVAALRASGLDSAEVERRIADGYRSGRFRAPSRSGVAYMLSAATRFVDPASGRTVPVGPHLMFYAPYLHDAQLGGLSEERAGPRHLPFVIDSGKPSAYIVVMLPQTAARTPIEGRP